MQHPNIVEFEVYGPYALFSDPITRVGGEKCSYQIPTYESIKGIISSVYWKPTFIWIIDKIRVMNRIQMEVKGIRPIRYNDGSNDLAYYTYLRDCRYQVQAHFEWNENRPELAKDRNENKHHEIAKRMINKGGRRDVFMGTRECQAYVEPCRFGEGDGAYDSIDQLNFDFMYHGITYADEAYSDDTKGMMTLNFWYPVMKNGIIEFPRPSQISPENRRPIKKMEMKQFGSEMDNFCGLKEFGEVI